MNGLPYASLIVAAALPFVAAAQAGPRWSPEKARAWMAERPWPVGCNYVPAYAANQLEMWQAPTFDPVRIDRELGWGEDIGFNTMRVFLHDLAWKQDPEGFLNRVDRFLAVADRHHIAIVMVIFDGVWNPQPQAGPQPAPTPGVHNSQWVQSPGVKALQDPAARPGLKAYVDALFGRFGRDQRILAWDLFNEADNPNARSYPKTESPDKTALALSLMGDVFRWGREADPIQPLTIGVWRDAWSGQLSDYNAFALEHSDIITFHAYAPVEIVREKVAPLLATGRPVLCTEYMARPRESRFETVLPYLKQAGIGALNWGFVQGKSQTLYAWDTWEKPQAGEPPEWFHDVLRTDGSPYRPAEVAFLRSTLRDVPTAYGWMPDGRAVFRHTLANSHGLVCRVITYGGRVTEMRVPDRSGKLGDIVLGYDSLPGYLEKSDPYFGALVGRVGNRIAKGKFTLDGAEFTLATNDGPNHLHGGKVGFDKVLWTARPLAKDGAAGLELHYLSRDGEEGYPGNLSVTVTYRLTDENELRIDYEARTDRDTPINLTNHTYWNLAGHGDVLGQILTLHASRYTPVDATLIPTGELAPVKGTAMDFTRPKAIGRDLRQLSNQPQGYDHNFAIDRTGPGLVLAAEAYDPASGRVLRTFTDQPGVQFYSGNFLDGTIQGKGGAPYAQHDAFCLETQHFPDAVHHPNFPSVILHPGETFRSTTVYGFSVRP